MSRLHSDWRETPVDALPPRYYTRIEGAATGAYRELLEPPALDEIAYPEEGRSVPKVTTADRAMLTRTASIKDAAKVLDAVGTRRTRALRRRRRTAASARPRSYRSAACASSATTRSCARSAIAFSRGRKSRSIPQTAPAGISSTSTRTSTRGSRRADLSPRNWSTTSQPFGPRTPPARSTQPFDG